MLNSVHFYFLFFKIWLQLLPFFLLLYSKSSRYMVLSYTVLADTLFSKSVYLKALLFMILDNWHPF